MITASTVWDVIKGALSGISGLDESRVFYGAVPVQIPTDQNGYILPYVVVWPGPGVSLDEQVLSGLQGRDAAQYSFQTTAVALDILSQLVPMTGDIADVLTDLQVGSGTVKADIPQQSTAGVLPSPDTNPVEYFVPLRWDLVTQ